MLKKIIVIGAGPYFWSKHYVELQKYQCEIVLIIDLEEKKKSIVERLSCDSQIKFCWINNSYKFEYDLPEEQSKEYTEIIRMSMADGILICSEPTGHAMWLKIAIRLGIPVYIEKPLTASKNMCLSNAPLYKDRKRCLELFDLVNTENIPVIIGVDRPYIQSYKYYLNIIRDIAQEFQLKPLHFGAEYSGGKYLLPREAYYMDNHPFKHGYGMLLHTGIHIIDMLFRVLTIFDTDTSAYNFELISRKLTHKNLYNASNIKLSEAEVKQDQISGEMSILSLIKIAGKEWFANGTLHLTSSGFCGRDLKRKVTDPYIGLGRVRSERYWIELGGDAKIVYEGFNPKNNELGTKRETIKIYRNKYKIGGIPFEEIEFSEKNECYTPLQAFLARDYENRQLENFRGTHELLYLFIESIVNSEKLTNGFCSVPK